MESKSTKLPNLEVNITDAFEIGKIEGARETLKELKDLAIVDPRFKTFMETRLKSFNEKIEIINKYKILMRANDTVTEG